MRSSYTPEEVDQIEEKAYGVGEGIGRGLERKRIIALLEAEAIDFSDYCTLPLDEEHCQMCNQYVKLIALIKGENNG